MGIALVFRHFVCFISLSYSFSHSKVMSAMPKQVLYFHLIKIHTGKIDKHFYEQSNLFRSLEH